MSSVQITLAFFMVFSSHMTAIRVFFVVFEKNGVIGRLTFVPQEGFYLLP